jgi:ferredoxin-like protein FixX
MIKICPNKCFIVLKELNVFEKYKKWLQCSVCGYMEKIKKKKDK